MCVTWQTASVDSVDSSGFWAEPGVRETRALEPWPEAIRGPRLENVSCEFLDMRRLPMEDPLVAVFLSCWAPAFPSPASAAKANCPQVHRAEMRNTKSLTLTGPEVEKAHSLEPRKRRVGTAN